MDRADKIVLTIAILSILAFVVVAFSISQGSALDKIDIRINSSLQKYSNPLVMIFALILHYLFEYYTVIAAAILISLYGWFKRGKKEILSVPITLLFATAIFTVVKLITQRIRPINNVEAVTDFSFPSGHTVTVVIFFGLLAYLISHHSSTKKRTWPYIVAGVIVFIVALSRIYLGVHWFSDVLGGFFLGLGVLLFSILVLRMDKRRKAKNIKKG